MISLGLGKKAAGAAMASLRTWWSLRATRERSAAGLATRERAACERTTRERAAAGLAVLLAVAVVFPLVSCKNNTESTPIQTSLTVPSQSSQATSSATSLPSQSATSQSSPSATTGPVLTITPSPVPKLSDGYRNYYEIFVRSFFDSNGDGLGDLAGVTAKLDYVVQTLGADGIWLMPICPSPTYHKYDVKDYLAIDPEYGTLADFDRLIAEAHRRDVRVIVDLVLNHTSNLHPWFDQAVQALWSGKDSPYIQYYHFTTEDRGQGYNKITDKYYYECRFVSGMPDLNLDNPAVREEIRKITQFWLDRGVDGFRLDAVTSFYTGVKESNIAFLSWLNKTVKAQKPGAYLVGEAWSDGLTIADYYASGIDSFFNFPYSQVEGQLVGALNGRNGRAFAESLTGWNKLIRQKNPAAVDALFLSNHDQGRSAGFLLRNRQKQKMAAAMYLLAPGNPFIYYGEELGMNGSGVDPNKRLPMLWFASDSGAGAGAGAGGGAGSGAGVSSGSGMTFPPPGATQTISGIKGADEQVKDPDSLLNFYRKVLEIKQRHPQIARGTMGSMDAGNDGVAAFSLTYQGKRVAVLHNLAEETVRVDLAKLGWEGARLTEWLVTSDAAGAGATGATGATGAAGAAGAADVPRLVGQELVMPAMTTAILA